MTDNNQSFKLRTLFTLITAAVLTGTTAAQTLDGTVLNELNRDPVPAATVIYQDGETSQTTPVNADGSFRFDLTHVQDIENPTIPFNVSRVYPNPSAGAFRFEFNRSEPVQMTVYDILGRTVISDQTRSRSFSLNLSNQPSGVYFVRFQQHHRSIVKRISKSGHALNGHVMAPVPGRAGKGLAKPCRSGPRIIHNR
ncbi:MAG: T9SS type A sorting domain-containing protein [candidate division KSB1 bacterium]|nr:T9SS type A sorting domain-containing protein [candidate division KSB1 bacterium]